MAATTRRAAAAPRSHLGPDLIGLALFFAGAASLLWLCWPESAVIANGVAAGLRFLAGGGAFVAPVLLMFIGSMFLVGYDRFVFSHATCGASLAFITLVTWRHIGVPANPITGSVPGPFETMVADPMWGMDHLIAGGGVIGAGVGHLFIHGFGVTASYLILVGMSLASLILMVDRPFIELLLSLRKPAQATVAAAQTGAKAIQEKSARVREQNVERKLQKELEARGGAKALPGAPAATPAPFLGEDLETTRTPAPEPAARPTPARTPNKKPTTPPTDAVEGEDEASVPPPVDAPFELPPLSLLHPSPPVSTKQMQAEMAEKTRKIEATLLEFGIGATVSDYSIGPTITRFEVQLAPGVNVNRIGGLANNLAMKLKAKHVRIEAPIPGKDAVGIEVPNVVRATVSLRECLESDAFRNAPGLLTFALGKDVSGQTHVADLARMPHMLIGGATNSGKSVCLNVLIASILYRATPDQVGLIMIDPKKVELSLWDGIPHLVHPVVREVRDVPGIFRAVLKEMDRRYTQFSIKGVRNIAGYNAKARAGEQLPYLVLVVDELADLMMQQQGQEIETSIARLAQLARATGIHLVIATQRPSVDVITGTIKSNIPSRLAFMCATMVDSRTVIDTPGAEKLIGMGDMLFMPIDSPKPDRIQGCYLSDDETDELVAYLRMQEEPNYTMTPVAESGGGDAADEDEIEDDHWEKAVRHVVATGKASASMLQRKFRIGYNRSSRLVELMEKRGIVGPADGAKPREILITHVDVERMFGPGYDPAPGDDDAPFDEAGAEDEE